MTADAARVKTPLVLLSLLGPAWAVLLTPTLKLYLSNQDELRHEVALLGPYLILTLVTWAVMSALYFLVGRQGMGRLLIWFYYIAGYGFIAIASAMSTIDSAQVQMAVAIAIAIIVAGGAILMNRLAPPGRVAGMFCVAMLALISTDIFAFLSGREGPSPIREASATEPLAQGSGLPNIYHIIFDEYQTDMFELALDEETTHALTGFTYFPETTAPFGRTLMSLPAIFTGKMYDFESPQIDYQRRAFSGSESILHSLRAMGYSTEAFTHKFYQFPMPLFDRIERHERRFGFNHSGLAQAFFDLWVYSLIPKPVSRLILGTEHFSQFEGQNVLSPEVPIVSYQAAQTMLAYESERAAHGRYTFLHLIVPHFPNVLAADCSFRIGTETTPLEQSMCANTIMRQILDELEALDRLKGSIVIFQGDHGSRYSIVDGSLKSIKEHAYSVEWSTARSRALLLIKPPDRQAPLEISRKPSSLLDVAPTLMAMLGETIPYSDGVNLLAKEIDPNRVRFYHFYEKLGEHEWTDSMMRYQITGSSLTRVGPIELRNNPKPEG